MRSKISAALVAALTISACMGGVASAQTSHAKANIELENHFCGEDEPEFPVIGTVTFKRVGNIVTQKVVLKHGQPNTTYSVELWGNECTPIGGVTEAFKTNKKGVGKTTITEEVPAEDNEFFTEVASFSSSFGDTPYVTLP